MAKAATIAIYTVRNGQGQFLGTYRAISAAQAISRHKQEQAAYFSTFKGSSHDLGYTAKVEDGRVLPCGSR